MNKAVDILFILIFLLIISVPMGGVIFANKDEISENEKRRLAPFPNLDNSSRVIHAFPDAFNAYVNDHFLFRKELVELNSMLRVKTLKTSPTWTVAIGKEGWLFAMIGSAPHDFMGIQPLDNLQLETRRKAIMQRQQLLNSWGGHYLHVLVPNKISIYADKAPDRLLNYRGQTRLEQISMFMEDKKELNDNYLDLTQLLREGKKEGRVYFKTDTHWTTLGAFLGYQAIINRLDQFGISVKYLNQDQLTETLKKNVTGNLSKFMGASDYIKENSTDYELNAPCAASASTNIEYSIPPKTYSLKKNGCKHAAPLRMVLISDSFGSFLVRYLNETFQEVILDRDVKFLDLVPYLKKHKPDLVIRLSVAHYMQRGFIYDPDLETNF